MPWLGIKLAATRAEGRFFYKTATNQPRIRDGMAVRVKQAGGDQRRAVAGAAHDAPAIAGSPSAPALERYRDGP